MALQPGPSDVHIDHALTNISVAYFQAEDSFVAGRVLPRLNVAKQSDKYFEYTRSYFNRDEARKRAPGTESAGGGYELSQGSYYCQKWAFHQDVAQETVDNADSPLDPYADAARFVAHKMLLRREIDFVDTFMTASTYASGLEKVGAGSASSTQVVYWDNSSATPILDVQSAITTVQQKTGYRPNVMVLSQDVFDVLLNNDDMIDRMKAGQTPGGPALVNKAAMAAVFGLERIEVIGAIKNTAVEGATESSSFIASEKALVCYVPRNAGLTTPSVGYDFQWSKYLQGANAMGITTSRIEAPLLKSTRIESEMFYVYKLISTEMGFLFSGLLT